MTARTLEVWLSGRHLGELERLRTGASRLRFDPEATAEFGVGSRLLSFSLPTTTKRVQARELEVFLSNLLPEGPVRAQLERRYGVAPRDDFGLLAHIGQECAGAIQFTHPGTEPGPGRLVPLTAEEVADIVQDLPTLSVPDGAEVTASLGGVQSKALLTETPAGWSWPTDGAMSSHLVKPEPTDPSAPVARIVELEHWALDLARRSGVRTAEASLERFGDRLALVVRRYDRADGRRLHQEDFAQALALAPGDKYEPAEPGPGRLRRVAQGVAPHTADPGAFWSDLLTAVAFNVLVGNGDAHAKNYSLLLDAGTFALAPVYDVAPIFYVDARFRNFGMSVAGQRSLTHLTVGHLLDEAVAWGMEPERAREVVGALAGRVLEALGTTSTDGLTRPVADRTEQAAQRAVRALRS